MLDWLKTILGDHYTEDIDKAVAAQIGKDFVARADFNAANEEKKTLTAQLKERDGQLEDLKKVDAAGLQAKIAELQEGNKTAAAQYEKQLHEVRLDAALDMAIVQAKGKNPKAVKALIDRDALKLTDKGQLEGLDMEALKKSDPYLFDIETTTTEGAAPGAGDPPAKKGSLADYQTRLAEARTKGDQLGVITIKQEAAEAGFGLL